MLPTPSGTANICLFVAIVDRYDGDTTKIRILPCFTLFKNNDLAWLPIWCEKCIFCLLADINECLTNNGGCSVNAECINNIGSLMCICRAGYIGTGYTCAGHFKSNIQCSLSVIRISLNKKNKFVRCSNLKLVYMLDASEEFSLLPEQENNQFINAIQNACQTSLHDVHNAKHN